AADVDDKQKKWAVTQFTCKVSDKDFHKAVHYPDSHINVLFKEALRRRLWPTVKQLIQRPIDDDLAADVDDKQKKWAITQFTRNTSDEDFHKAVHYPDSHINVLFKEALGRRLWPTVKQLIQRPTDDNLDTGNTRFVAKDDESPRKCFNPLPALTEDQQ
ncbi:hypothetical protein BaRGS_00025761, partial [Batillaria attramentaria]